MVTLIGENDEGPSEKAITAATARLRLEGRLVGSVFPAEGFKDFNDPLRRSGAALDKPPQLHCAQTDPERQDAYGGDRRWLRPGGCRGPRSRAGAASCGPWASALALSRTGHSLIKHKFSALECLDASGDVMHRDLYFAIYPDLPFCLFQLGEYPCPGSGRSYDHGFFR